MAEEMVGTAPDNNAHEWSNRNNYRGGEVEQ